MPIDIFKLELVFFPATILKQPAEEINEINDEVRAVSRRMIEMLYEHKGVGLAGPQIGLPWRIFVTRAQPDSDENIKGSGRVFINPILTLDPKPLGEMEEGCLSLPDIHINIMRPMSATISAFDENGKAFEDQDNGYCARVWQHEFDHLNGTLIIDRMTPMDRLVTRKAIKSLRDSHKEA